MREKQEREMFSSIRLSLAGKRMLSDLKQMATWLLQFGVTDALKYTEKVTFVKKGNVERHLSGEAHKIAVQAEGLTCTTSESNTSTRGQVSIVSAMKDSSRKAYTKLFEAAYNLTEGMLPFNKFQVLVKCLRDNKVKLIQGRDDHRACEEYVSIYKWNLHGGKTTMLYLNLSGHDIFKKKFGTSPEKHCLTAMPYRLFSRKLAKLT